eukprot:jgi/Mesen1/4929/ME000246S04161
MEVGGALVMRKEQLTRCEKRKLVKKQKRKQRRQQEVAKELAAVQKKLGDPREEEQQRAEEENRKIEDERQRQEHERQERLWLEREREAELEAKRREEEQKRHDDFIEERKKKQLEWARAAAAQRGEDDDGMEDDLDGPAEIIWVGNEIIAARAHIQSRGLSADRCGPPDKVNCPFYLKTGACRYGSKCSRSHVYPAQSHTLLVRNMYSGPALAGVLLPGDHADETLELDQGTSASSPARNDDNDDHFVEFYDDVHSEFLKYGELVNFKVCRNVVPHLRGNVYAHYARLSCALQAFAALHGRFYASKQIMCEFVAVRRWKSAICGEYMQAPKRCRRGVHCSFLHPFHNPGGDYSWADWDRPPPSWWTQRMRQLFGRPHDDTWESDDAEAGHARSRHGEPRHHGSSRGACKSWGQEGHSPDDKEEWGHKRGRHGRSSRTEQRAEHSSGTEELRESRRRRSSKCSSKSRRGSNRERNHAEGDEADRESRKGWSMRCRDARDEDDQREERQLRHVASERHPRSNSRVGAREEPLLHEEAAPSRAHTLQDGREPGTSSKRMKPDADAGEESRRSKRPGSTRDDSWKGSSAWDTEYESDVPAAIDPNHEIPDSASNGAASHRRASRREKHKHQSGGRAGVSGELLSARDPRLPGKNSLVGRSSSGLGREKIDPTDRWGAE